MCCSLACIAFDTNRVNVLFYAATAAVRIRLLSVYGKRENWKIWRVALLAVRLCEVTPNKNSFDANERTNEEIENQSYPI